LLLLTSILSSSRSAFTLLLFLFAIVDDDQIDKFNFHFRGMLASTDLSVCVQCQIQYSLPSRVVY
jgi:hypothetical protein